LYCHILWHYIHSTPFTGLHGRISHFFIFSNALRCSLILKIIKTLKHVKPIITLSVNFWVRLMCILLIIIFDTKKRYKEIIGQNKI
jgi:hypothetical protein